MGPCADGGLASHPLPQASSLTLDCCSVHGEVMAARGVWGLTRSRGWEPGGRLCVHSGLVSLELSSVCRRRTRGDSGKPHCSQDRRQTCSRGSSGAFSSTLSLRLTRVLVAHGLQGWCGAADPGLKARGFQVCSSASAIKDSVSCQMVRPGPHAVRTVCEVWPCP